MWKLRAQSLAKGGSVPSQVARVVGCTHCGSEDHVAVNCRAAGAHPGKGKGGPTIPKGRGKGSSGSLLPPGCDAWSELKRKASDSLVASLAEHLTAGHCGWCGSSGNRAPEAGSDPRGHLGVTWGVYLCAGKPPLADIILSHPPDLTRCDSVIGLAIPAMSGHIQYRGAASGDLYIGISGINRVLLS